MTTNAERIDNLERISAHLQHFINDKEFRAELSRNFKGFAISGDDIDIYDALTDYIAILKQHEGAT